MNRRSRRNYLRSIYVRYERADRREKQRILDEFCANRRYHRKHAIRLLNQALPGKPVKPRRRGRSQTCGPKTRSVLKAVWEAADYPWSVRLEDPVARVDAMDSSSLSAENGDRAATVAHQRAQHQLPAAWLEA